MQKKPEILCVSAGQPWQVDVLARDYNLHRYDLSQDKPALLQEVGSRVQAVVTTGGKGLGRELIEQLPELALVASSGVGYDLIDVAACTERGIRVTNTPDVLTDDVADIALLLVLAARRRLLAGDAHVRSGEWGRSGPMPLTSSLAGSTIGIVGLGRIGLAIAERARAFSLEVAYTGRAPKAGVPYAFEPDVVSLARRSDILVAALAGGAETRGLIGREALEALGPSGTFVNVARGTVVDEAALVDLLRSGALGSAGLDVFLNEPLPSPRLTELETVTLYPHHASATQKTRDAMSRLVIDNVAAFFEGRALPTPVN